MTFHKDFEKLRNSKCTGEQEHAFCGHLLANFIPRQFLSKQFMSDGMNDLARKDIMFSNILLTGSRSELLHLPDYHLKSTGIRYIADYDRMHFAGFISKHHQLTHMTKSCCTTNVSDLNMRTRFKDVNMTLITCHDLKPGYCHVGILHGKPCVSPESLGTERFLLYTHQSLPLASWGYDSVHNAATCTEIRGDELHGDISQDSVPCFVSEIWPDEARSVFVRHHKSWPDYSLRRKCEATCKLLIVRKAHPLSKNRDIEFRFSFSLVEVLLSRSLPDEVRYVYLTVKLLCKVTRLADTPLKSYHLKTILYWIASREDIYTWEYSNFRRNVVLFLTEVASAFRNRTIPNFFVPDSNLIEHLSIKECQITVNQIQDLLSDLCRVVCTATLNTGFVHYRDKFQRADMYYDAAKYHLRMYSLLGPMAADVPSPAEIQQEFEAALQLDPTAINCLVNYGEFSWIQGDTVRSYVSWLNALVIYFNFQLVGTDSGILTYTARDCKRLDAPLRRHFKDITLHKTHDCVFFHSHVLAVYFLLTRHGMMRQSAKCLIAKVRSSVSRAKLEKTGDNRHEVPGYLSQHIISYCEIQVDYGKEQLFQEIHRIEQERLKQEIRDNVYDVCQAVCEYVRHHRTSFSQETSRRPRRHSYSGTAVTSRRGREQGWAEAVQLFLLNFNVAPEIKTDWFEVWREGSRRLEVTGVLVDFARRMCCDDAVDKERTRMFTLGLLFGEDGTDLLEHVLGDILFSQSEEVRNSYWIQIEQLGRSLDQQNSLKE